MVVLERSVSLFSGSDGLVGCAETSSDLLSVPEDGVNDGGDVNCEESGVEDDLHSEEPCQAASRVDLRRSRAYV